jgi:hypothetical protein
MFGMKAFGKYLQFTKENCIATNTLKLDQIVQAGKLLTAEV